ncbi:MAG: hypothetical protein R3B55_01165 [Candidatus Paceibacterota bacterium]
MKEGAPKASERILERIPVADVESVVTAKGSTYSYLPNGTTQRMKKSKEKNMLRNRHSSMFLITNG